MDRTVYSRRKGVQPFSVPSLQDYVPMVGGFFITSAKKAARRIIRLLRNPEEAELAGRKAHEYVKERFLMPDRVADYLRIANYFINDELDEDHN